MNMAIIVVDGGYLKSASQVGKAPNLKRLKKQLISMLFERNKRNRSPFPDRVWERHSALLNASRRSAQVKGNR